MVYATLSIVSGKQEELENHRLNMPMAILDHSWWILAMYMAGLNR